MRDQQVTGEVFVDPAIVVRARARAADSVCLIGVEDPFEGCSPVGEEFVDKRGCVEVHRVLDATQDQHGTHEVLRIGDRGAPPGALGILPREAEVLTGALETPAAKVSGDRSIELETMNPP